MCCGLWGYKESDTTERQIDNFLWESKMEEVLCRLQESGPLTCF